MNKLVMATVLFLATSGGLFSTAVARESVQGSLADGIRLFTQYDPSGTTFGISGTIFTEKKEIILEARRHSVIYIQTGKMSPFLKSVISDIRRSGDSNLENFTDDQIINEIAEF
ncbi:MAG: hypothetical protein ACXVCP_02660 [Bdellovibrio sp.]